MLDAHEKSILYLAHCNLGLSGEVGEVVTSGWFIVGEDNVGLTTRWGFVSIVVEYNIRLKGLLERLIVGVVSVQEYADDLVVIIVTDKLGLTRAVCIKYSPSVRGVSHALDRTVPG